MAFARLRLAARDLRSLREACRPAPQAVGRIVAHCVDKDADLRSLSREDLRAFHPAFSAASAELLSLERALEGRALPGATARPRVVEALDAADAEVAAARRELEALS